MCVRPHVLSWPHPLHVCFVPSSLSSVSSRSSVSSFQVVLAGTQSEYVDGVFTDDPGGFGQEHPAVQSAVQLTNDEIAALQLGTCLLYTS